MRLGRILLHRSRFLPVFLLPVLLASCSLPPPPPPGPEAGLLATPYLQAVTDDSVFVLVERETADPVSVEYGLTESYGSLAATESTEATGGGTFIHNVKLAGLAADTMYHYRLAGQTEGWTFWTAAESGTAFRLAWFADCRAGWYIHDLIARRIGAANPRFSLYGGDRLTAPEATKGSPACRPWQPGSSSRMAWIWSCPRIRTFTSTTGSTA